MSDNLYIYIYTDKYYYYNMYSNSNYRAHPKFLWLYHICVQRDVANWMLPLYYNYTQDTHNCIMITNIAIYYYLILANI